MSTKTEEFNQVDRRKNVVTMIDGRREGEGQNPYTAARLTWDDVNGKRMADLLSWKTMCFLLAIVVAILVGAYLHVSEKSVFVPFIVKVDRAGRAEYGGVAKEVSITDAQVVAAALRSWIVDAKFVTKDAVLKNQAQWRVYSMLSRSDPAFTKMTDFNTSHETSPLVRAETSTVEVNVLTVLQQTHETWEITWEETTRNNRGHETVKTHWRGLVTIYMVPAHKTSDGEASVANNPFGIFVKDYSWTTTG